MLVLWMDVRVLITGAVGATMATVHGAVKLVDASILVVLLRGSLRRSTYIQNLSVVSFPGLTLPQLSGLSLDPDSKDDVVYIKIQ